ncbi:unnamed protein product [Vitrella brassicaformis CCMP3155]|uniref:Uncharacterized protein n=4 Tax=Vitrella brassicaformis TaxID=1169539 RepID=A0A0G4EUD3_VITBC|nr:unnamed protein product [Vitrella brassicaformis CCMP3155]|eukprot:CEM01815.1 unnamed protein product [Vitrella brassicaformis CCMP3155]
MVPPPAVPPHPTPHTQPHVGGEVVAVPAAAVPVEMAAEREGEEGMSVMMTGVGLGLQGFLSSQSSAQVPRHRVLHRPPPRPPHMAPPAPPHTPSLTVPPTGATAPPMAVIPPPPNAVSAGDGNSSSSSSMLVHDRSSSGSVAGSAGKQLQVGGGKGDATGKTQTGGLGHHQGGKERPRGGVGGVGGGVGPSTQSQRGIGGYHSMPRPAQPTLFQHFRDSLVQQTHLSIDKAEAVTPQHRSEIRSMLEQICGLPHVTTWLPLWYSRKVLDKWRNNRDNTIVVLTAKQLNFSQGTSTLVGFCTVDSSPEAQHTCWSLVQGRAPGVEEARTHSSTWGLMEIIIAAVEGQALGSFLMAGAIAKAIDSGIGNLLIRAPMSPVESVDLSLSLAPAASKDLSESSGVGASETGDSSSGPASATDTAATPPPAGTGTGAGTTTSHQPHANHRRLLGLLRTFHFNYIQRISSTEDVASMSSLAGPPPSESPPQGMASTPIPSPSPPPPSATLNDQQGKEEEAGPSEQRDQQQQQGQDDGAADEEGMETEERDDEPPAAASGLEAQDGAPTGADGGSAAAAAAAAAAGGGGEVDGNGGGGKAGEEEGEGGDAMHHGGGNGNGNGGRNGNGREPQGYELWALRDLDITLPQKNFAEICTDALGRWRMSLLELMLPIAQRRKPNNNTNAAPSQQQPDQQQAQDDENEADRLKDFDDQDHKPTAETSTSPNPHVIMVQARHRVGGCDDRQEPAAAGAAPAASPSPPPLHQKPSHPHPLPRPLSVSVFPDGGNPRPKPEAIPGQQQQPQIVPRTTEGAQELLAVASAAQGEKFGGGAESQPASRRGDWTNVDRDEASRLQAKFSPLYPPAAAASQHSGAPSGPSSAAAADGGGGGSAAERPSAPAPASAPSGDGVKSERVSSVKRERPSSGGMATRSASKKNRQA